MPLDADVAQIVEALRGRLPVPTPDTDVVAYRAMLEANPMPRAPIDIHRVETFSIDGPGGPLRMRLFADGPDRSGGSTLLYFHGGGFVICNIDTHDYFCRRLAKASGWRIVSVDYRLAPENRYPAAVDDGYAALLWAASPDGAAKGIDPAHIAVGGDSAGGGIAAVVAQMTRDRGGPSVIHQLLIYPVTNRNFDTPSYRENGQDYFLTEQQMRWFWDQYVGPDGDAAHPYASPGRASDFSGLPPATVITAGYDPLRDEAHDYARHLKAAGVQADYRCFEGAIHGFAGMETLASSAQALEMMAQTLKRVARERA
jgi:acetyl esterase